MSEEGVDNTEIDEEEEQVDDVNMERTSKDVVKGMRITSDEEQLFDEMKEFLHDTGSIDDDTNSAALRYCFFYTCRDISEVNTGAQ